MFLHKVHWISRFTSVYNVFPLLSRKTRFPPALCKERNLQKAETFGAVWCQVSSGFEVCWGSLSVRPEQLVKLQQLWQRWCRRRKSSSLRIWQKRCANLEKIMYFIQLSRRKMTQNDRISWNHIWCCFYQSSMTPGERKACRRASCNLTSKLEAIWATFLEGAKNWGECTVRFGWG